jgi:hypothetical protein
MPVVPSGSTDLIATGTPSTRNKTEPAGVAPDWKETLATSMPLLEDNVVEEVSTVGGGELWNGSAVGCLVNVTERRLEPAGEAGLPEYSAITS